MNKWEAFEKSETLIIIHQSDPLTVPNIAESSPQFDSSLLKDL